MEKNMRHGKHEKYFRKIGNDSSKKKVSKAKDHTEVKKDKPSEAKNSKKTSSKSISNNKNDNKNTNMVNVNISSGSGGWIFLFILAVAVVGALIYFLPGWINSMSDDSLAPENEFGVVVATVNGQPIYSNDIEKRLLYYQAQFGPDVTEDFVINQTVNELLLLEEAKKQGIKVDDARIDNAISQWLENARQQMGDEQLEAVLAEEGLTLEEYITDLREVYRKNFLVYNLLNKTVFADLDLEPKQSEVTEEEMVQEFEENPEKYSQVKVSHILICHEGSERCQSNRSRQEAEDLSDEIYQMLIEGEDFAELAREYSDCPSSAEGGELDWFSKDGNMAQKFKDASFNLKNKNQFTKPVETEFGYHIIKLLDKKDSYEDFKTQISMQLQIEQYTLEQQRLQQVQQQAVAEYIDVLREDAVIDYTKQRLTEGISPDPSIKTFSMNAGGKVCTEEGKPVVYMFSTTWCGHCKWVSETFDDTMKEQMDAGNIVAYHWELDTGDNTLTQEVETEVPEEHLAVYKQFNPQGSIPTFVFGCKYYRIGNGYEHEKDLAAEKAEFMSVITQLS